MRNNLTKTENSIFFQQMDICCQKITQKVGAKDISDWKNSDYIKLNRLLRRETKVNLSDHTLKRIFGKLKTSSRYYPQKATRDALAQFIGFKDWYEFTRLHPASPEMANNASVEKKDAKKKRYLIYIGTFILIVLFMVVFIYYYTLEAPVTNVKLTCINPDGPAPRSAIFKLSVDGKLTKRPDLFRVDFSDSRPHSTNFSHSLINHFYETPGRYFPVLYYKKTAIDTIPVYLQNEGWSTFAAMKQDTSRVFPLSNKPDNTTYHHVTAKEVFDAGVDTSKTFIVSFVNVKPTDISADNFEFSAFIKTSANRSGVRCSPTNIIVYGENDNHFLSIIRPQCAAFASYKFSEIARTGENTDLRYLGYDLSNGGHVRIRIEHKHVLVSVDQHVIFKSRYNRAVGKCMGVKIAFAGIGTFTDFKLQDLKTKKQF